MMLMGKVSSTNANASNNKDENICDYKSVKSEINLSDHYRADVIELLCKFSAFNNNTKSLRDIKREDLLSFLDSFRKIDSVDPLHKMDWNIQHIQDAFISLF